MFFFFPEQLILSWEDKSKECFDFTLWEQANAFCRVSKEPAKLPVYWIGVFALLDARSMCVLLLVLSFPLYQFPWQCDYSFFFFNLKLALCLALASLMWVETVALGDFLLLC